MRWWRRAGRPCDALPCDDGREEALGKLLSIVVVVDTSIAGQLLDGQQLGIPGVIASCRCGSLYQESETLRCSYRWSPMPITSQCHTVVADGSPMS